MVRLSLSEFADKVNELMPVIIRTFLKQQSTEFYKTDDAAVCDTGYITTAWRI